MIADDQKKVSIEQEVIANAADYLDCFEEFYKEVDNLYRFLKRDNPAGTLMIELRKTKQKLLSVLSSGYHRKYGHPYIKLSNR